MIQVEPGISTVNEKYPSMPVAANPPASRLPMYSPDSLKQNSHRVLTPSPSGSMSLVMICLGTGIVAVTLRRTSPLGSMTVVFSCSRFSSVHETMPAIRRNPAESIYSMRFIGFLVYVYGKINVCRALRTLRGRLG